MRSAPEIISFRPDPKLHELLTLVANVQGTTVSAVIRDAMSAHFDSLLADETFRSQAEAYIASLKTSLLG